MPASLFTAENIVALMRAAPDSDGTYADVCKIALEFSGCDVSPSVLGCWVRKGRSLADAGIVEHPYAQFAREFVPRLPAKGSGRDRGRAAAAASLQQALSDLETRCDCGRPKDRDMPACTLCTSLDGELPARQLSSRKRREREHAAAH